MVEKSFFEKNKTLILVGAVILLLVLWTIGIYNSFISLDQGVKSAWSITENEYQRQADLIPNLAATLKNYQQFEAGTLTQITELRSRWQGATTEAEKDQIGVEMSGSLGRLIATFEAYPDLKSITAVKGLMDELAGAQNRITVARQRYIETIQAYNKGIMYFPNSIFAGMFGYQQREYYQAAPGSLITPNVSGLLG